MHYSNLSICKFDDTSKNNSSLSTSSLVACASSNQQYFLIQFYLFISILHFQYRQKLAAQTIMP